MSVATLPPPLPRVKPPPGAVMPFDPAAACAALLAESDRRGLSRYELAKRSGIGQPQFGRFGPKTTAATLAALLSGLGLPWRWLDTAAPLDPAPAPPPKACPRCGSPVGKAGATYCDRPECRPAHAAAAPRPARAARRAEVLAMHAAGRAVTEIVTATGYSTGYVYSIIRTAKGST